MLKRNPEAQPPKPRRQVAKITDAMVKDAVRRFEAAGGIVVRTDSIPDERREAVQVSEKWEF